MAERMGEVVSRVPLKALEGGLGKDQDITGTVHPVLGNLFVELREAGGGTEREQEKTRVGPEDVLGTECFLIKR